MVASTHWLASAVGMAMLERGGNAFDAAVAAGFTLQVVEPHLNGPGGDLPAIFWSAARGGDRDEQLAAARELWYSGFVAEAVLGFSERKLMDSSGERHAGLLAAGDLAGWHATLEPPLAVDYHGHTVLKAGPWSQAPVFLQQLRLLEPLDLGERWTAESIHTVVECAKLAFADREAWYGDPDFVDVPLETLLSPEYADERRRLIGA